MLIISWYIIDRVRLERTHEDIPDAATPGHLDVREADGLERREADPDVEDDGRAGDDLRVVVEAGWELHEDPELAAEAARGRELAQAVEGRAPRAVRHAATAREGHALHLHTCYILPPSEIDLGLCLAVFAGSGGKYLFHRIG